MHKSVKGEKDVRYNESMLTKEQSLTRNKHIISSLLLMLVPLGGWFIYKDLNQTPTFYTGGTLTNYERTLKLDKQYEYVEGTVRDIPDTEYLGYFTFLKEGFNEHTISLTSNNKPKSIHKHIHFDTESDSVTNTFTTDGIVIDTNYKTVETKTKTLGAPTPNIKQTFILRNTTDETKETSFTSTTKLNTNTVEYNGRTITITETPTTLKAEEKTASIPEFASDIGYENPEETEDFANYTHTYHTPAFLTFTTDEGTAVYDWRDAQHLDHTVTLYQTNNEFFLSFTVDDIAIDPQSSFTIDPAYGLDDSNNYDVRYDGYKEVVKLGAGGVAIGDVNGDSYSDLLFSTQYATYGGREAGSMYVIFGTSTVASGIRPQTIESNFNVRYDGAESDWLTIPVVGDVNGDGIDDLVIRGYQSTYVIFSTLIDDVGMSTGNTLSLASSTNYNVRYEFNDPFGYGFVPNTIGDVNGDGLEDLVLGSEGTSYSYDYAGSVWVIFSTLMDDLGLTTGNMLSLEFSTSYNVRFDGGPSSGALVRSGATVGDVNGDDKTDLLIPAPYSDYTATGSGSLYVAFSTLIDDVGTTTGNNLSLATSTNYNVRYDGDSTWATLTESGSVAVGDINNDTKSDLILGSDGSDNRESGTGSVFVMFSTLIDDLGTTTGNNLSLATSTNYNIRYDGAAASIYLTEGGNMLVGDVNGDGVEDVVLGSYRASNNGSSSGSAWVIFSTLIDDFGTTTGNNLSLATSTNYNIRYDGPFGDQLTQYGTMLISDVNGDGLGDLGLASIYDDGGGNSSGSVYLIFSTHIDNVGTTTGNNFALSTSTNYNLRYDGAAANEQLTYAGELYAGDIDGDNKKDLIMGSYISTQGGAEAGSIWTVGSTLIDDVGSTTGNFASLASSSNYKSRYDGGNNDLPWIGRYGAIATGDVNGDSLADLVIGSSYANYAGIESGSVFVILGGNIDVGGSLNVSSNYNIRFDGDSIDYRLADEGAVMIGDVNGDGIEDLMLGAAGADNAGNYTGSAWIMLSTLIDDIGTTTGNVMPLASSTSYNIRYDGSGAFDYLWRPGDALIDDVNGDGVEDLIFKGSQSAFVIFSTLVDDIGTTTGNIKALSNSSNYNIKYAGPGSFPSGIVAHDLNGDGLKDLAFGAYGADYNGNNSGSTYVIFSTLLDDVGETTGNAKSLTSTTTNFNIRYDGSTDSEYLSFQRALRAGDVNGDGLGDLVMGSYYADHNGNDSGSAYVVFSTLMDDTGTTTGNILPFSTSANYNIRFDGGASGEEMTKEATIAIGDVNGDDLGDLVLGAQSADHGGFNTGSAYVLFSTLIDDVGTTTGNNKPFSTSTNYNIRYDGPGNGTLTRENVLYIADMDNDGFSDLMAGSGYFYSTNGAAFIMRSTLIDNVGGSTGNNLSLASSTSYSTQYTLDGYNYLTQGGSFLVDDLNNDGAADIAIGAFGADYGNDGTGSVWLIYGSPPPKYRMNGTIEFTGSVSFE